MLGSEHCTPTKRKMCVSARAYLVRLFDAEASRFRKGERLCSV